MDGLETNGSAALVLLKTHHEYENP